MLRLTGGPSCCSRSRCWACCAITCQHVITILEPKSHTEPPPNAPLSMPARPPPPPPPLDPWPELPPCWPPDEFPCCFPPPSKPLASWPTRPAAPPPPLPPPPELPPELPCCFPPPRNEPASWPTRFPAPPPPPPLFCLLPPMSAFMAKPCSRCQRSLIDAQVCLIRPSRRPCRLSDRRPCLVFRQLRLGLGSRLECGMDSCVARVCCGWSWRLWGLRW